MPPRTSLLSNPRARSLTFQVGLLLALAFLTTVGFSNLLEKLAQKPALVDTGFWTQIAGFDINQSLLPFAAGVSTYAKVFLVGLLNTLLIAAIGIVLATLVGFTIGVARLSSNWLIARLATFYVEGLRNIPLLLQLLFWYNAVLKPLPLPKNSIAMPGGGALNNRGLFLPAPQFGEGSWLLGAALALAVAASLAFWLWARRRQERTGERAPVAVVSLALLLGLHCWLILPAASRSVLIIPN